MSEFGHNIAKMTERAKAPYAKRLANSLIAACIFTALAGTASAQGEVETNSTQTNLTPSDGLTLNIVPPPQPLSFENSDFSGMGLVGLSPSLKGVDLEIPSQSVGSRLFDLDVTNINCLTGEHGCTSRSETLDLGYQGSITTKFDGKFDIQLMPRASVSFTDESSSAVVGALVRIGNDLREDSDLKANTWYMFAGADAEAVTYSPNSVSRITSGEFHLQDRIIVGDAQAGVGYKIGDADVSLGYFRREVTSFGRELDSNGVTFKEDAAALSFTWRR